MTMRWAFVALLVFLVASRGCKGARNHAAAAKRKKNVASGRCCNMVSPEAYWQKTVPNLPIPDSLLSLVSPLTFSGAAHVKGLIKTGKLISNQNLSSAVCEAAGLFCNPDIPDASFLQPEEVEDWPDEVGEELGPWGLLRIEEEGVASEIDLAWLESDIDIFKDDEPLLPAGDYDDFYDLGFKPQYSPEPELSTSPPSEATRPRTWMKRFFTITDLMTGDVNFHAAHLLEPPISRKLLTPDIADLLPIRNTQELWQQFHIPATSQMGRYMSETATSCDPVQQDPGETKACVSSLEALADFLASQDLEGPAEVMSVPTPTQEFLSELSMGPLEVAATEVKANCQTVTCRNRIFPFHVFECSSVPNTQLRLVYLDSELNSGSDVDATALALCHMDTADWSPDHEAFLHLGKLPGDTEVCQFLPQNAFVFFLSNKPAFGSRYGDPWPDSSI